MGGFANSVLQTMVGWVRTLVSLVWNYAADATGPSLLEWVSSHWISLAVGLCILGAVVDLVIYLIRWRPYLVWKSFFRRKRARGRVGFGREPALNTGISADRVGANRRAFQKYESDEDEEVLEEDHPPSDSEYGIEISRSAPVRSWGWKENPDSNDPRTRMDDSGFRGYRSADLAPYEENYEDEDRTTRFEQALRPRRSRRSRVSELIGENTGEQEYVPPEKVIDSRDAYRRPVYPSNWRRSGDNRE